MMRREGEPRHAGSTRLACGFGTKTRPLLGLVSKHGLPLSQMAAAIRNQLSLSRTPIQEEPRPVSAAPVRHLGSRASPGTGRRSSHRQHTGLACPLTCLVPLRVPHALLFLDLFSCFPLVLPPRVPPAPGLPSFLRHFHLLSPRSHKNPQSSTEC